METPLTANSFWQLLKVSEDGDRCVPYHCTELLGGVVVSSEGLQPVTSLRQKKTLYQEAMCAQGLTWD